MQKQETISKGGEGKTFGERLFDTLYKNYRANPDERSAAIFKAVAEGTLRPDYYMRPDGKVPFAVRNAKKVVQKHGK